MDMGGGNAPRKVQIEAMLRAIAHRGPDGQNMWLEGGTALGFNRLSFIDLTGGMQPLFTEDRGVVAVINGEIYNHPELREELEKKGHTFRTRTDVEVVLHLYEEEGEDFPKRLNGQFGIALFDTGRKTLYLVRDQMGVCPLYWTVQNGRLLFGSEAKAILALPDVKRKLNLKALDQLMNFPGVVAPETFFEGIRAIRPGHMIRFRAGEEPVDTEYWDLVYPREDAEDKGLEAYAAELRELIVRAIRRRLVADVPIGFYVSGGLDSSVVACFIGKYLLNSYYSFSAEIGEGDLDESRFQKIVSQSVKSDHRSVTVGDREIIENLPSVIYHAESAVKESYDTAAFLLSELVRTTPAKAVLTGQGSDELFCGYVGYMVDLFRNMNKDGMSEGEKEINSRLWGDPYFRYERDHDGIRAVHRTIYSSELASALPSFSALSESPIDVSKVEGLSTQRRRSYIDCKLRLGDHLLLEHGDRMFFSHSVEGRHPFLDPEIVAFVTALPDKYKMNGAREKYILKKAAEGIVPDPIVKRRKFPFQAPGMSSLVKAGADSVMPDPALIRKYGLFDEKKIEEMKKLYSDPSFRLMGAYEIDYLLSASTVTILCETYGLSV